MLGKTKAEAQAYEEQGIGRILRMGQTRPIHVYRFYTKDTIEENLLGKIIGGKNDTGTTTAAGEKVEKTNSAAGLLQ